MGSRTEATPQQAAYRAGWQGGYERAVEDMAEVRGLRLLTFAVMACAGALIGFTAGVVVGRLL